jgi:hypothetical protein
MARTVLALCLALWVSKRASAELVFDPPTLDLGKVKAGQVFTRTIHARNASRHAVAVIDVKSSCGCLAPTLTPQALAPGQVGVLTLQINTLSSHAGPQGWRVVISLAEAGALHRAEFVIQAVVVQEIVVEPSSITVYGGRRSTEHTIRIVDQRATPLEVRSAESSSPLILLGALPETTGAPAGGELKLTIREGFAEGRHDERVTLYTNDLEYPMLQIPITVIRRSSARFIASPPNVVLNRAGDFAQAAKRVVIRDTKGEELRIERIESLSDFLEVQVERQMPTFATVSISIKPLHRSALPRDPGKTQIDVHLAGQKEPLRIGVEWR